MTEKKSTLLNSQAGNKVHNQKAKQQIKNEKKGKLLIIVAFLLLYFF